MKGSVLIHVLLAAIVLGLISAGILDMMLQPAMNGANLASGVAKTKAAEAAVNKVSMVWMSAGKTCASASGVGCDGTPGTCVCRCEVDTLPAVVSAGPAQGPCSLTVDVP